MSISSWLDTGGMLRMIAAALELPTHALLLLAAAVAVLDAGMAAGERWRGLRSLGESSVPAHVERLARRRIERVDVLARVGPMLGLMGTLIPLGPGLAALGRGDVETLAASVTVAFDTTVLGLLVGIVGFVVGRLRRRWYETLLDGMEASSHAIEHDQQSSRAPYETPATVAQPLR